VSALRNRVRRLARASAVADRTFKMVIVRGNFPEEHAAEVERLKREGMAHDGDWFIYEPCVNDAPASEVTEVPTSVFDRILREIAGQPRGLPSKDPVDSNRP
jgi:hypothetical protein